MKGHGQAASSQHKSIPQLETKNEPVRNIDSMYYPRRLFKSRIGTGLIFFFLRFSRVLTYYHFSAPTSRKVV